MSTYRSKRPPVPNNDDRQANLGRATKPYAYHQRNPAGSKMLRKFYIAKHGVKPKTLGEAREWREGLE